MTMLSPAECRLLLLLLLDVVAGAVLLQNEDRRLTSRTVGDRNNAGEQRGLLYRVNADDTHPSPFRLHGIG